MITGLSAAKGCDWEVLYDRFILATPRTSPVVPSPLHNAHYRLSHCPGRGEMPGRPMSSASRHRRMQTMWMLHSARKASKTPPRRRAHGELQLSKMEGGGKVTSI